MTNAMLIKQKLKRLRLPGVAEALEERLKEATKRKWGYSEFLELLLTDEILKRDNKQMVRKLARSGLDPKKSLETFDYSFNPKINELLLKELGGGDFLEERENVFILGPSGVGKSHIAQAIGNEVCRRSKDVLFYRMPKLLKWVHGGRGDGTHGKRLEEIIKCSLLIIDDFGLQQMSVEQQDDLYEIICQRYEQRSMILTSNRDVSEWMSIFDNPLIGSAAVDRLVHKAITIVIEGDSYRLWEYRKRNNKKEETENKK